MADKDLGVYEIKIKVDATPLDEVDKSAIRAKESAEDLTDAYVKQKKATDSTSTTTRKLTDAQDKLDREFRQGKIEVTEYQQKLAILDSDYKRLNNTTAEATRTTGALSSRIQQAGFQIGDFATQLAGGQSAMLAFTQQGGQMAGSFGPGGAVLGAVLAIGGAFAMHSLRAEEAAENTDNLAEAMKNLGALIDPERFANVSEGLEDIADVSIDAARLRLRKTVEEAKKEITGSAEQLRSFFEEYGGSAVAGLDSRGFESQLEFQMRVGEQLGITAGEVEQLNDALNETKETGSPESLRELLRVTANLQERYGESSRFVKIFSDIVNETGENSLRAADGIKQAEDALKALLTTSGGELEIVSEQEQMARDRLGALNKQVEAIQAGANALEVQAQAERELFIQQQASKGVSEEIAAATFDQAEALKKAVDQEKDRIKNINTAITARMKERDWVGELFKEQERAAKAEQDRVDKANASADQQLMALRAQVEAINNGATATEAAFIAQQKLLEAQLLSQGVTKSTVDETIKLKGAIRAAGQDAGSKLSDGFDSAASSIAGSVTNAVISGDWEGTGEQIGATLGAAIGTAIGGPVGGSIGSIVGSSLFGGGSEPYTGAEDRAEEVAQLLGDIADKSELISDATDATANALNDLVGVNRELLEAQKSADKSLATLGFSVANELAALYFGGNGFANLGDSTFANAASFGGAGMAPERAKLSAVDDIGFILSGAISNIDVTAFQDLGGMIFESYLPGLESGFQGALDQGIDLIEQLGGSLGFTAEQIEASIAAVDPSRLGMIGTAGMGAEEQAELAAATVNQLLIDAASGLDGVSALLTDVSDDTISALNRTASNIDVAKSAFFGLNDSLEQLTALELGQASNQLAELFGDGSGLSTAVSGIFSAFASESEQADRNLAQLRAEFTALGMTVPASADAVIDLVHGLDLTTEAGRDALSAIERSTEGLRDFFDVAEAGVDDALSALRDSVSSEQSAIRSSLSDQLDLIDQQRAAAIEANKLQLDASKERVSLLRSEVRGIQSAISSLRGSSEFMTESDRRRGLADLQSILSSGGIAGAGEAAELASQLSESLFGSASEFESQRGKTLAALEQLDERGSTQLSTAELQLAAAQNQTAVIKDKFDELEDDARRQAEEQIVALEDIFNSSEQQINVLRGIDNSVLSVADAIKALDLAVAGPAPSPTDLVVGSMDVMPAFANGGLHSGGAALVGERGPEIAMMGAARVVPNSSLSDILGGMEIAGLRDDMRSYFVELIKTGKQIRKLLGRWDVDGVLKRDETVVQ